MFRRTVLIGLGALMSMGALGPLVAAAETPAPQLPTAGSASPPASTPSQSTSYKLDPSQFSLLISPTRLILGPKDIGTTQTFTVVNRGQSPLVVLVQKRNFTTGKDGSLQYAADAPYAASAWVSVSPTTLRVAPGATQLVTAAVKTPPAYEPGEHQMALIFLVPAGKTGGNIKINRGVATPVFVSVPGPTSETVTLSDLSAPGFVGGGPVAVTAQLRNIGTVHRDFRGETPLLLNAGRQTTRFPDFTIPRGSIRDIEAAWDPPFLCICHPSVTVTNANGAQQTLTLRVIVFPWMIFAIALGALFLALLLVRLARRQYQSNVRKAAAVLHHSAGH